PHFRRTGLGLDHRRAGEALSQVQREGAAPVYDAVNLDLAAEQRRELAADGEAEARAAIAPAGARIGLLEGLEDQFLLVAGNADAGVRDVKADDARRLVEDTVLRIPPTLGGEYAQAHAAALGELERIRQQVLENLLQALGIGEEGSFDARIDRDLERQL